MGPGAGVIAADSTSVGAGIELRTSVRTAISLNQGAISPASPPTHFLKQGPNVAQDGPELSMQLRMSLNF